MSKPSLAKKHGGIPNLCESILITIMIYSGALFGEYLGGEVINIAVGLFTSLVTLSLAVILLFKGTKQFSIEIDFRHLKKIIPDDINETNSELQPN